MKTGRLRDRVEIQTYADSFNDYGETVKSWTEFATVYAEVTSITGKEILQAGSRVQGEMDYKIIIRHLAGIKNEMRVLFGTRVFEIKAILPDRTNAKRIILMCMELVE